MPEKVTSLNGLKVTLEYGSYTFVKAQLKCPLSSSIKMTTLISHSLY